MSVAKKAGIVKCEAQSSLHTELCLAAQSKGQKWSWMLKDKIKSFVA